jgi:protein-disulfide isomerase
MAKFPAKIRLIHRHFPMDDKINPLVKEKFHVGSGAMALMATYAQIEGKFWEINDIWYSLAGKRNEININEVADTIGLNSKALAAAIYHEDIRYKVKHDITRGIKLGINGTPAFVIDGQVYFGNIPQQILKKVLEH